jgi:hypothetical protein
VSQTCHWGEATPPSHKPIILSLRVFGMRPADDTDINGFVNIAAKCDHLKLSYRTDLRICGSKFCKAFVPATTKCVHRADKTLMILLGYICPII